MGSEQKLLPGEVGTNDKYGTSVAMVPDLDGDGDDECVVGAPEDEGAAQWSGVAYLFPGGSGGVRAGDVVRMSPNTLTNWDLLGSAVTAADFDGDGQAEVLAGASWADWNAGVPSGGVMIMEVANGPEDTGGADTGDADTGVGLPGGDDTDTDPPVADTDDDAGPVEEHDEETFGENAPAEDPSGSLEDGAPAGDTGGAAVGGELAPKCGVVPGSSWLGLGLGLLVLGLRRRC